MTKAEQQKRGSAILATYSIGAAVTGPDFDFLLSLLHRHPRAAEKIGCGVHAIRVRTVTTARFGPGRCFEVEHTDGKRMDFSYLKCINVRNWKTDVASAFREAITDQVYECRDNGFAGKQQIVCPITGDLISRDDAHVDHAAPRTFDCRRVRLIV
jgi:Protein of unknown function (DUF3223)